MMMLRSTKTRLAAVLTLPWLWFARGRAEDWPQWRGPNRDGVCGETGLLETFRAGGLKVRWRVPVGWGFSSPVVAQGRVFLADSELTKPKARERLHCLDEATGKPLWTHSYDVAYEDWAFDPTQEIGPVATPIVQNGKVYTVGRVGHLFCLDTRNGEVLWQSDMQKEYRVAFAPGTPSPLIEGDLIVLFVGGKPGACVVALHKDTGKEVWKALDESQTPSSPIVIYAGGRRQLIVWTQESVTSLDPAAGTTYWRQQLVTSGDYAVSTPVHHKDRLLLGGLMFQLDSDKPAAAVLWPASRVPSRRIFSNTSTALFQGDHLFSAKSSGELICVEASTGKQVWESTQVTDLKGGASIHLTPNGDSVLLYTDKGELIRAQLSSDGYKEISRVLVLEPTFPFAGRKVAWSHPAYANRHIFARSGKELIRASLAAEVADDNDQSKPTTPAEQYQALLKEQQALPEDLSNAGTDEERKPAPLFSESFDDQELLKRAWYDGSRFKILGTDGIGTEGADSQPYAGKGCIEYRWNAGTSTPASSSGIRHRFEPSDAVYLRCYIKLSKGWGWSGRSYHPHLMHFMTTENEKFAGPAASHLTVYIEPWNGKLRLAAQDIQNKDAPHGLTQGPLKGGYNGQFYDSKDELLKDDAWHCVEAMFQLNTLDQKADKPNADGIVRGWFDGKLVIDRTGVILRSTDFPKMKFNQFLLTPYFGPGLLPHAQTLWIDELAVGTTRLGPVKAK